MVSDEIENKSSKIFSVFFVIILLIIIFIGAYSAITAYLEYNSEKVKVSGTVLSSDVERDSSGRRGISYDADIEYKYEYHGESYKSDNIKPGRGSISESKSEAESLVSSYPKGDVVNVYLDKENPSKSWLVNELPIESVLTSLLLCFVGIFILYKNYSDDISSLVFSN